MTTDCFGIPIGDLAAYSMAMLPALAKIALPGALILIGILRWRYGKGYKVLSISSEKK